MKWRNFSGLVVGLAILLGLLAGCSPSRTIIPFNGKDLNDWEIRGDQSASKWTVGIAEVSTDDPKALVVREGEGQMINISLHTDDSRDIYSKVRFGDCRIELELMIPEDSNSGIYLMGKYELQVGDSYGREEVDEYDTMGAIFGVATPLVNACKAPGEWQECLIEFSVPKFDADGNKIANAKFIKVEFNGQLLHDNVEVSGPTGAREDVVNWQEELTGPIMFQGNHGPVAYRNIRITDLSSVK